jgi:hypothetical protein
MPNIYEKVTTFNDKKIKVDEKKIILESNDLSSEYVKYLSQCIIEEKTTLDFLKKIISISLIEIEDQQFHNILQTLFKSKISLLIKYYKHSYNSTDNDFVKINIYPYYQCSNGTILSHLQYSENKLIIHKLDISFASLSPLYQN